MGLYDSKAPGVYIEEVSGGARPIQAVGTSTAGFVGRVLNPAAPTGQAIAVNNWLEFVRRFRVDPAAELQAAQSAQAQAQAEVTRAKAAVDKAVGDAAKAAAQASHAAAVEAEKRAQAALTAAQAYQAAVQAAGSPATHLVHAVYGFFLNGGGRCYVSNLGPAPAAGAGDAPTLQDGLDWLALRDEVAIVAAPGFTGDDYEAVLAHCEQQGDRVAILDPEEIVEDTAALADAARKRPRSSAYGSFYFPWIQVRDPFSGDKLAVPPSGHLAGVWARTDAERGVHKAPANTPIRGALGLTAQVADDEQGVLNQAGVNCIRFFSSEGILVWGARTLSADPEWRYLNVRRLLNMIEESIEESTRWAVFEPNDTLLWSALRRNVRAFLMRVWQSGALSGTTPEQAFFCKCDEETNPPENIDAGVVTTVVGVAPVKPAEFVVFQIRQYQPSSEVETQGG